MTASKLNYATKPLTRAVNKAIPIQHLVLKPDNSPDAHIFGKSFGLD
jgi:hypothetical protein